MNDRPPIEINGKLCKWKTTRCPYCGREYQYPEGYKPATCNAFECSYKNQHPELKRWTKRG